MRILSLNMIAFGHLADQRLEFPRAKGDFHVVYGPNEAGKSTALRAVESFLFGFRNAAAEAHRFLAADLRVGAIVELPDGTTNTWVRKNGRRHTLLDLDGNPVATETLSASLGDLDGTRYLELYGLSHERLRRAGEEMVTGHGDAAELLFGASTGFVGIRKLRERLNDEQGKLFKETGKQPRLNVAIDKYRKLSERLLQVELSASAWEQLDTACSTSRARVENLTSRIESLKGEHDELSRRLQWATFERVRAPLARELAFLQSDTAFSAEDYTLYVSSRDARRELEGLLVERSERLRHIVAELANMVVDEPLICHQATVDAIRDQKSGYERTVRDLLHLAEEERQLRRGIEASTSIVGAYVELGSVKNINELALLAYREASEQFFDAKDQLRSLEDQLAAQRALLCPAEETEIEVWLDITVATACVEEFAQAIHAREQRRIEVRVSEAELTRLAESVGLSIERLGAAGIVPAQDQWRGWVRQEAELESILLDHARNARAEHDRANRLRSSLHELIGERPLPTESELHKTRAARDALWREHLDNLSSAPIRQSFVSQLEASDRLADELRAEAARAATIESLRHDLERTERAYGIVEQAQRESTNALGTFRNQCVRTLREVPDTVQTIQHAAHFCENLERALQALTHTDQARLQLQEATSHTQRGRARLEDMVHSVGLPNTPDDIQFLSAVRSIVQEQDRAQTSASSRKAMQHNVDKQLRALEARAKREAQRIAELQAELDARTPLLGITASPGSRAVLRVLCDELAKTRTAFASQRELKAQAEHLQMERDRFEDRVRETCRVLQVDEAPVIARVSLLLERAARASEAQERKRTHSAIERELRNEVELLTSKKMKLGVDIESIAARLGGLALSDLENRANVHERRLKLEEQLQAVSLHAPTSTSLAIDGIGDLDTAHLEANLERVRMDLRVVQDQRDEAVRDHSTRRSELDARSRTTDGALLRDELRSEGAEVGSLTHRLVVLAAAQLLLRRELEHAIDRESGTVLARAGELLEHMTSGAYRKIILDSDSVETLRLIVVNKDARPVPIARLSDGTRDQVYLALRVASLERTLAHEPRLPLLIDDVLVHFDDRRAERALSLFADLARHTQVLYFTHHTRVVEAARALGARVHVQTLGDSSEQRLDAPAIDLHVVPAPFGGN